MKQLNKIQSKKPNFVEYLSNFVIIVNTVRLTLTENLRIILLTLQYLKSLVNLIFEENKSSSELKIKFDPSLINQSY